MEHPDAILELFSGDTICRPIPKPRGGAQGTSRRSETATLKIAVEQIGVFAVGHHERDETHERITLKRQRGPEPFRVFRVFRG